MKIKLTSIASLIATCLSVSSFAQLPQQEAVSKAVEGYSNTESIEFINNFKLDHLTTGAPGALWFQGHAAQIVPTALLMRQQPVKVLNESLIAEVGKIEATTTLGTMDFDTFLTHPNSYAQGVVIAHKGEIVYESYPGMHPLDPHFWASNAKVTASLAIGLLIDDGLVDENKTIGYYVPEFRGTAWENITVADTMDMTTGLDAADSAEQFFNPDSVTARLFRAELGEAYKGKVEDMLDVLSDAKPISEPSQSYRYSSAVTQLLVYVVEAVTGKPWAKFIDERVWSQMGVEGPLQVHLSPDGIALAHGPLSSNLRDMVRLGILYTPSADKVTDSPIISDALIDRIQNSPRSRAFYHNSEHGQRFTARLGVEPTEVRTAARQWDAIFEDGDFFKSGLNGQGLYVSPDKDLVVGFFSTEPSHQIQKYLRPIVTSDWFTQSEDH